MPTANLAKQETYLVLIDPELSMREVHVVRKIE